MSAISKFASMKFDNTLGAMLIGLIVSTTLFGLTTLQTYIYYVNYRKDGAVYKWLVGTLWLLDFTHTIFISHSAYHFLVRQYGKPAALSQGEWSIILEVTVTVCVTVLVQCFFAVRVYRLSQGNWIIAALIVTLTLGHASLGIASTIRLFQIEIFARLPEVMGILSATLVTMAVNDLLITVAICWYLQKAQRPSGTHDAVSLLIVYTVETGMVTSVFVTITAVCVLTMPNNWIFIGLEFCLSKLYANSLLTILNSRHSVRKKFGNGLSTSSESSSQPSGPPTAVVIRRVQVLTGEESSDSVDEQDSLQYNTQMAYAETRVGPPKFSYAV